jgi:molybdenum cofactor cytidylyltransferase
MIPGLILAAGASARMGRPKPLLQTGGRSFVSAIIQTLRAGGLAPIVVVIRPGSGEVADEIVGAGGLSVVNPSPDEGQLSSLLAGLDAVETAASTAVLVTLVDAPSIRPETVALLLARLSTSDAPILRATYRGRHGHPVVFRSSVFGALRGADPRLGAKVVLRAHVVEDVEIDDPGIVDDIDTPEDYARVFGVI